jgi:geranylgeranyl pyrophosphate synthase
VQHAYRTASEAQRRLIVTTLGNPQAPLEQIAEVTELFKNLGSIAFTVDLARQRVNEALKHLEKVPPSYYRDLLADWAQLMIEREF